MAFSDDLASYKVRSDSVRTDLDASIATLQTALFNRLRPTAPLAFLSDADLSQACLAFAVAAARSVLPTVPLG